MRRSGCNVGDPRAAREAIFVTAHAPASVAGYAAHARAKLTAADVEHAMKWNEERESESLPVAMKRVWRIDAC
ncbi:TPA: hypothetical protein ACF6U4_005243, partial [Burkholderia multivorans]